MRRRPPRKHTRFGSIEQQVMCSRRRRAVKRAVKLERERQYRLRVAAKIIAAIEESIGGRENAPLPRPKTREEHLLRSEARGIRIRKARESGALPRMAASLRAA